MLVGMLIIDAQHRCAAVSSKCVSHGLARDLLDTGHWPVIGGQTASRTPVISRSTPRTDAKIETTEFDASRAFATRRLGTSKARPPSSSPSPSFSAVDIFPHAVPHAVKKMPTRAKRLTAAGNSRQKNPRSNKSVSNAVPAVPDAVPAAPELVVNDPADPADPAGGDAFGYDQQLSFNADAAREAVEDAVNEHAVNEPEPEPEPAAADEAATGKRAAADEPADEPANPSKRAKTSAEPNAAAEPAADNKSDATDAAAEAVATLSAEPTVEAAADADADCAVETAGVSIRAVIENRKFYSLLSPLFTGKEFKVADDNTRERVTAIITESGLDPTNYLHVFYALFWSWTNYIYTREQNPRKIDAILAESMSQLLLTRPCFHLSKRLLSASVGCVRLRDEFVVAFEPGVADSTARGHLMRLAHAARSLMSESGVVDTSKLGEGWEARLEEHTKRDARGGRKPGVPNNDKSPSSKPRAKRAKPPLSVVVARATLERLYQFFPEYLKTIESNKAIDTNEFKAAVVLLTRCGFEVSIPETLSLVDARDLQRIEAAADTLREIESPPPSVEKALAGLDAELARMKPVVELLRMGGERLEEMKVEMVTEFAVCLGRHVVWQKFRKLSTGLARLLLNPAAMRTMMELDETTPVKNVGQNAVCPAEAMLRAIASDNDNIDVCGVLAEELAEEIKGEEVAAEDVLAKFGPVFDVAVNTDSPEATAKALADLSKEVDEFTTEWTQLFQSREPASTIKKVHKLGLGLGIGAARARAAAIAE
jgi:hypothetical protein